ncbi:MAG: YfiR family protein [Opitutae bacterium]|nr:YfiR family protein [Opitutae bacterium]
MSFFTSRFKHKLRARRSFVLLGGLALLLGFGTSSLQAQAPKASEEERRTARVQATYLSHLVNFTRWEKRHLPAENESPKIVVVGNENRGFVDSLAFLIRQNALRIEGQLVKFEYFENSRKAEAREMLGKGCQLVYILPNSSFTPREINDLTESAVVFGEGRGFVTDKGGDVSFVTVRNRVKLVVSEKYFRRTSPKLSSKLVNLKSVVEIIPSGGPQGPRGRKGVDTAPLQQPPPSR